MKKEEFIDKWLVGYEDLEQKAEFSKEMMQDLESLTEPTPEVVVSAEEVLFNAYKLVLGDDVNREEFEKLKTEDSEEVLFNAYKLVLGDDVNREEFEKIKTEDSEEGNVFRANIQAMHTYASQTRESIKGEYSIEEESDGTYKLYKGRDNTHHGLWLCSLSEFDMNKESTIRTIVNCLNQTREEEMKKNAEVINDLTKSLESACSFIRKSPKIRTEDEYPKGIERWEEIITKSKEFTKNI